MRNKTPLIALSALAILAGACVSDDPDLDLSSSQLSLTSGLVVASDCDQLLGHLKAEALERVGPYGFGHGGRWELVSERMEEAEMADSPMTTTAAADLSGGLDSAGSVGGAHSSEKFSGTNNQEQGVDEPDLVKTDGRRIVIVAANELRIVNVDGSNPKLGKTVSLGNEFWGGELFLVGDRAFVMSNGWSAVPLSGVGSIPRDRGGVQITQILEVDLVEAKVVRTMSFEGSYLSARESAGTIRIVLPSPIGQNFEFLYPQSANGEERATEANKEVIEDSTIEQWLPGYKLQEGKDVVAQGQMVPCDRVHIPGEFAGMGAMNIITIKPESGLEIVDAISVLTTAQTVYSSTDRMTIGTYKEPEFDPATGVPVEDGAEYSTALHNFDITDETKTTYVASGSVKGSMLSQYSLSEHNGYLRVATTAGNQWWGAESNSESFITVLEEEGDKLVQVGQVGELGKGERIFSVRFMGDIAYVVTFRQIDPLYTIDLSEPTNPTTLGELKIPGFSSYLHPVGDDVLVGVGQDGTDEGDITGALVSAFDVKDLANPTRIDKMRLAPGNGDGSIFNEFSDSPVGWDARAFTWWAEERIAIIPVSYGNWDQSTNSHTEGSDAVVVKVAEDGTLTELGRISQPRTKECESGYNEDPFIEDLEDLPVPEEIEPGDAEAAFAEEPDIAVDSVRPEPGNDYCWSWTPHISRTVIVDANIYSISDAGVLVNALDGLAKVAWLPFG